jgi:DNA-binding CsgD family transcriptional regulator
MTPTETYAQRRPAPKFMIFTEDRRVVAHSPDVDPPALASAARRAVERGLARAYESDRPVLEAVDGDNVVRVVRLAGDRHEYTAVFFERAARRGGLEAFVAGVGLTKREADVARLLLRSYNAGEIARMLAISESTVADHTKRIYRKAGCTRRSELFARAYGIDEGMGDRVVTLLP